MLYSGIDLHKDNCLITTVNDVGKIVKQEKLLNDDATILNYFFSFDDSYQTVVESTLNWYWLSDLLTNHGIGLVLAHAKYLKAIAYAKVKTDKVDSLILAQLLRMGFIRYRCGMLWKMLSVVNSQMLSMPITCILSSPLLCWLLVGRRVFQQFCTAIATF